MRLRITLLALIISLLSYGSTQSATATTLLDPVLQEVSKTQTSITLAWTKQVVNGDPVLDYILATSKDGGTTWRETNVTVADDAPNLISVSLTGMNPATARFYKVSYTYNGQQSHWSNTVLSFTKGISAQRVSFKTMAGAPLAGGAVTWELENGKAKSSVIYGLTSDGYIDFPAVPAGNAFVTLTNGLLADGTRVSGTFNAFLGFDPTILYVPNPPISVRTVTVQLPNGIPVAGAHVEVQGDLSSSMTLSGFEFKLPTTTALSVSPDYSNDDWLNEWDEYYGGVVDSGYSDNLGRVNIFGYTNGVPGLYVEYDDGVITQNVTSQLNLYNNYVELEYAPYVQVLSPTMVIAEGDTAAVSIEIADPFADEGQVLSALKQIRAYAQASQYQVRLVSIDGASSGACGATGKAKLEVGKTAKVKVCATESGTYKVKTGSGVFASGTVKLHVKGAAPMQPQKVSVESKKLGSATLTWKSPEYTGGASITKYIVTATSSGKGTITKSTKGKSLTFTGLAHSKKYTFEVKAVTKNGTSRSAIVSTTIS